MFNGNSLLHRRSKWCRNMTHLRNMTLIAALSCAGGGCVNVCAVSHKALQLVRSAELDTRSRALTAMKQ